jgi:hypothetical protein
MAALAALYKPAGKVRNQTLDRALFFSGVHMNQPVTKDMLLRQVDGLRDLARRARRLIDTMTADTDKQRLGRYVEELDGRASELERQAADAKTGQFAVIATRPA